MKILVVDEKKHRGVNISEELQTKGHEATHVFQSPVFIDVVEEKEFDQILLDFDSWQHGKSIYSYFSFEKKLEGTPIIFYNAPENFISINNRSRHEGDRVLNKPTDVLQLIDAIIEG